MSFRFFRRIKLLPGLRLNLSKSGVSLSAGVRGASVTVGPRGSYANFGVPGTGLSYRTRLDRGPTGDGPGGSSSPESLDRLLEEFPPTGPQLYAPEPDPLPPIHAMAGTRVIDKSEAFYWTSVDLLVDREPAAIQWRDRVAVLGHPEREMDDEEFDRHARAVAAALLARRVLEGDRDAWGEILAEELRNERIPFAFSFDFQIEHDDRVHVDLQLPDVDVVGIREPVMLARAEYEDVCCAFVLRVAHEVFRVLPDVAEVHLSGYRLVPNPSTGFPYRETLLRFATDRGSFSEIRLDLVDPSAAFAGLGGASRTHRGELVPIAIEAVDQAGKFTGR